MKVVYLKLLHGNQRLIYKAYTPANAIAERACARACDRVIRDVPDDISPGAVADAMNLAHLHPRLWLSRQLSYRDMHQTSSDQVLS